MWEEVVCIYVCSSVLQYYECVYMQYGSHSASVRALCALMLAASILRCFKSHFRNSDVQLIAHSASSGGSTGHMALQDIPAATSCMLCKSQLNFRSPQ